MNNYKDLIEFRNKLVNDSKFTIYEEDCQLLDKVLDDYEQFKQQLEEKDKEIERLKVFEKAYYYSQLQASQKDIDLLLQNAYQTPNDTQLAIQELEKVKKFFVEDCVDGDDIETGDRTITKDIYEVADYIDNQIKELKGE